MFNKMGLVRKWTLGLSVILSPVFSVHASSAPFFGFSESNLSGRASIIVDIKKSVRDWAHQKKCFDTGSQTEESCVKIEISKWEKARSRMSDGKLDSVEFKELLMAMNAPQPGISSRYLMARFDGTKGSLKDGALEEAERGYLIWFVYHR